MNETKAIKIAVVGDVHDRWEPEDGEALKRLGVDLVLFVGDFGNESVDVVRAIAQLDIPKAAVFGNHDAWYTATEWGRSKCPYDRTQENRVKQQLDLMGEAHVGYRKRDFPELEVTVVGSRPFSWGGSEWKYNDFYSEWFGVESFEESARLIAGAAADADCENVIFLGHTGPTGLGEAPDDLCGRDWKPLGGDWGDPDFASAIDRTHGSGKHVPLVTFGHMHHQLRHTKHELRKSVKVSAEGTVYLNAASVPRIVERECSKLRNFSIVLLENGTVSEASLVWLGEDFAVALEQILYRRAESAAICS
ncbi:TIGR04168 family protein [Microcoleus sp. LEGE 07076]|uniref:TIGR04168 family protein n=1 Tax=Microcoleus sp. LEGE 07076 TaxID=915322 RepID=UPI0018819ECC|nr:TIGR04168 family protein [Microcoleus sp. LEGE 07076]MBE9187535.1 TIGR04168 family protein [Microcoleus sp. LEGE 07076]